MPSHRCTHQNLVPCKLVSFSYCNCALLVKMHPDHFNYQLVLFLFNIRCDKAAIRQTGQGVSHAHCPWALPYTWVRMGLAQKFCPNRCDDAGQDHTDSLRNLSWGKWRRPSRSKKRQGQELISHVADETLKRRHEPLVLWPQSCLGSE